MKLKKLSLPEWLLIAVAIALMLLNTVLQLEVLRYVMWGLVIAVVVLNMLFESCPNCGKRVKNNVFICPRCGKQLIEVEAIENDEEE